MRSGERLSQTLVMTEIAGARALVIGGTGGLGREMVGLLVSEGATVVSSSRRPLGPEGAAAHIAADVTVAADRERIIDDAMAVLGGLDVVVIASGVVGFGPVELVRSEDLSRLIEVDLTGPLALCGLVAPMIDAGGSVAVVTGAIVDSPMLGTGVYAAAKAGLSVGVGVMAREWRRRDVRFIDVRPPHTETGLAERPLFGAVPRLGEGLTPAQVASRIVAAIAGGETVVEPSAFVATGGQG